MAKIQDYYFETRLGSKELAQIFRDAVEGTRGPKGMKVEFLAPEPSPPDPFAAVDGGSSEPTFAVDAVFTSLSFAGMGGHEMGALVFEVFELEEGSQGWLGAAKTSVLRAGGSSTVLPRAAASVVQEIESRDPGARFTKKSRRG